ncbi:MAG: SH3 domain-containing protein [bacterium]|nr:SH3 domain-containing protein [bacterium]
MPHYRTRRRPQTADSRSVVAFLLISCFGIMFAGCGATPANEGADEFSFTEDDVARFRELVIGEEGSGDTLIPHIFTEDDVPETGKTDIPVLDLSLVDTYNAVRMGAGGDGEDIYRVTNAFVNMRAQPRVTGEFIDRMEKGTSFVLIEFHDAAWAKIRLPNGREGYVATRYIAKNTSEENLAAEKKQFEGLYLVNFGFLNVRKDPDANSVKLGELQSQALVRPLSTDDVWARVPFDGGEGYVAVQYLKPFLPNFLVRQDQYRLPILHYRLGTNGLEDSLVRHLAKLQSEGVNIMTFKEFRTSLLQQEDRDIRIEPRSVLLGISGLTSSNLRSVSDVLRASGISATLFIETAQLRDDGITDALLLTQVANGHDIQSAGHTGDDLRSLTDSQVDLELKQSRQILEQKTGKDIFAVAFPLGGVNQRVADIAADAGFLMGVSATPTKLFTREQLLRMPSYSITSSMTDEDVFTIIVGE